MFVAFKTCRNPLNRILAIVQGSKKLEQTLLKAKSILEYHKSINKAGYSIDTQAKNYS